MHGLNNICNLTTSTSYMTPILWTTSYNFTTQTDIYNLMILIVNNSRNSDIRQLAHNNNNSNNLHGINNYIFHNNIFLIIYVFQFIQQQIFILIQTHCKAMQLYTTFITTPRPAHELIRSSLLPQDQLTNSLDPYTKLFLP
jgi:hypothetical protein